MAFQLWERTPPVPQTVCLVAALEFVIAEGWEDPQPRGAPRAGFGEVGAIVVWIAVPYQITGKQQRVRPLLHDSRDDRLARHRIGGGHVGGLSES